MSEIEAPPNGRSIEDVQRQALEAAAAKLEQQRGNALYMAAWRAAAKIIRAMKPVVK